MLKDVVMGLGFHYTHQLDEPRACRIRDGIERMVNGTAYTVESRECRGRRMRERVSERGSRTPGLWSESMAASGRREELPLVRSRVSNTKEREREGESSAFAPCFVHIGLFYLKYVQNNPSPSRRYEWI